MGFVESGLQSVVGLVEKDMDMHMYMEMHTLTSIVFDTQVYGLISILHGMNMCRRW